MRHQTPLTALLLAFALLAAPAHADESDAGGTTTKEAPKAEAPVTDPKLAAEQARIQKAVDDLMPVVAKLRGLDWKRPVKAAVMTRPDLRKYMISEIDKETTPEEWARDTRILQRVGLLKANENLKDMALNMFESAVAGFYNPQTGNMFVIEGMDVEGQKPTIVHELIHALEDQHFDLEAMEKPHRDNDPDRQFAIRCLWEGSAEYARRLYQDQEPSVAQHYYVAQGKNPSAAAQQAMMQTTPTYMLLSTLLHYRTGPNFVMHQFRKYGYVDGLQRLFDDPPTTQEHVLHPHKWLGSKRDYPRKVVWGGDIATSLGAPWKKIDEHSIGELDLAIFLDYFHGDKSGRLNQMDMGLGKFVDGRSSTAARGWDAGRAMFIENDDHHMIVVQAFAFDSASDAEEAGRLLAEAARKAAGDTWKGDGWQRDEAAKGQHMTYDFHNRHGHGRVLIRGQEVLVLDGAPDGQFDAAWGTLAKTRFEQDTADQGDSAPNPFEGYDIVDARRGLGLKLPAGWTAKEGGRSPAAFATATKDGVSVTFIVIGQEMSHAGMGRIGKMLLGPMFSEKKTAPTSVMGEKGLKHPLPTPPGMHGMMHFAADLARTYVVAVTGPKDKAAALADDIQRMLDGMPGPLDTAPKADGGLEGEGKPPAGLRSIPGY
ncbi:MAG: hypothetical protein P1V36_06385 [Planctomycetota bacterium]|nr:hypothetical protein [Planctomycetota bacterium]